MSQPSRERFAELERLWSALRARIEAIEGRDVPEFNALLREAGVGGVIVKVKTIT